MVRPFTASNYQVEALSVGWELLELPAAEPGAPPASPLDVASQSGWEQAIVPGTVASARRARGTWSFDTPKDFDEGDYWYRCRFASTPAAAGESLWLRFDGLATLAEVWLNGTRLFESDNMFLAHEVDVTNHVGDANELLIRFASVAAATRKRRPRPRFRTRLIDRQQLRWIRTTLLGRMPGWSAPVAPVGPWREVTLERRQGFCVASCELEVDVAEAAARVVCALSLASTGVVVARATLRVGAARAELAVADDGQGQQHISGELAIPEPELWWPASHGPQPLHAVSLELHSSQGLSRIELEPVGFRRVEAKTDARGFALSINGVEIRCFGACWTPTDVVALHDPAGAVQAVRQAHAAGMNMLRVGGTMIYECDAFYRECDRLGILVWQDFMFANCDYPAEDAAFSASVQAEARQLLGRLSGRACLAVLCGSSEVEQQICMLGLPREAWKPPLFAQQLRELCEAQRAKVPYLSSTPTGGALPFQANAGVTHYYGVGAYLRPLEDARRADVKFAAECLAFANVPESSTVDALLGDVRAPFHDPRWKARVPRDHGAGWDFDDVRDHYTRLLFGEDPVLLRYQSPERALELARVTSGEVMARTLAEWRRGGSNCRGALIWLFRDLWPGAGWGLIDSLGIPKAAYYYVKRSLKPRALFISDEGVNGASIEVANSLPDALLARIELTLWRDGSVKVASGALEVEVPAHGTRQVDAALLLDGFLDVTHAYRFGPPAYQFAVARLVDAQTSGVLSEAHYFPTGLALPRTEDLGLEATVEGSAEAGYLLSIKSQRFAQSVAVEVPGYRAEDAYFHVAPDLAYRVRLEPLGSVDNAPPRGHVRPLNSPSAARIVPKPAVSGAG